MDNASKAVKLTILAVMAGCVPPAVVQPRPLRVESSRPPAAVIQIAARDLAEAGFDVSAVDAAGGVLSAKRVAKYAAGDSLIVCRFSSSSMAANWAQLTFQTNVVARADSGRSTVSIASHVRTEYPNMPLQMSPSETDCASSQAIERAIARAAAAP